MLGPVLEPAEIDGIERSAHDSGFDRLPFDRRDPRVRVLHVVDGILHRLRGDDIEVERLRRVDREQQERHPHDVGIDLVENVGERDDVARARERRTSSPPRTSFTS